MRVKNKKIVSLKSNKCRRGEEYAEQEFYDPRRVLTTTIKVESSGSFPLLSIRTDKPIPKKKLRECMQYLANIEVEAPINIGQVIVSNILNTGSNVIATRRFER
jgi:CxxC motif-containing protein